MDKNRKLTFVQKIEIVKKFQSDKKSMRNLANEYKSSKSTIARILKNREKYIKITTKSSEIVPPCVNTDYLLPQTSKFRDLDTTVFEAFVKLRSNNIGINGNVLRKIGLQVAQHFNLNDFKASNGWIDRFRTRHKLQFKSISGEVKSADLSQITAFLKLIEEKMQAYDPKDIWNCDETALQYKNPPTKSYVTKDDDCKGSKQRKERVTILLCCSLLGEKYSPLIISKSKSPRCMRNFDIKNINVQYLSSKNAWMTSELFNQWAHELNNEMVSQTRKILLILDNAPCHIMPNCSAIEFLFLPKNTTAVLQPLDMGVIKSFKNHYFNILMESFLLDFQNISLTCFDKINVKDVAIIVSMAWDKVSLETIQNCFKKAIVSFKNSEIATGNDDPTDEVISEVVMETLDEIQDQDSDSSESSEICCEDGISNDLKNAVNTLNSMDLFTRTLAPDSLKNFYVFRMDFLKNLRKSHGFGNKITDYFENVLNK